MVILKNLKDNIPHFMLGKKNVLYALYVFMSPFFSSSGVFSGVCRHASPGPFRDFM